MLPSRAASSGRLAAILLSGSLLLLAGCDERRDVPKRLPLPGTAPPAPVDQVAERDLRKIQGEGVLRIITRPDPLSYMIFKGSGAGFEYELLRLFCDEWNLRPEVVMLRPGEDPYRALDEGRGDVLAVGLVADNDLKLRGLLTQAFEHARWHLVVGPSAGVATDTLVLAEHDIPTDLTVSAAVGTQALEVLVRHRDEEAPGWRVRQERPHLGVDDLLRMASRGEVDAVVVPDAALRAAQARHPGLRLGPPLGPPSHRTWLLRRTSPELRDALDRWLSRNYGRTPSAPRRSRNYGIVHDRYVGDPPQVRYYTQDRFRLSLSGELSPWDAALRRACDREDLDWVVAAALMFEESRFDPDVVSVADAVGLMQVLPRVAEVDSVELHDPETNIGEGIRMLAAIWRSFDYLAEEDRWPFTLATYHAGIGHMNDARRIAMDAGLDPNRWRGNVEIGLKRKRERVHFPSTRHGYYRGHISVRYAESILARTEVYRYMLAVAAER